MNGYEKQAQGGCKMKKDKRIQDGDIVRHFKYETLTETEKKSR